MSKKIQLELTFYWLFSVSPLFILMQVKDFRNFPGKPPFFLAWSLNTYFLLLLPLSGLFRTWALRSFLPKIRQYQFCYTRKVHLVHPLKKNHYSERSLLKPRKCAFSFSWYFLMLKSNGQDSHLSTVARAYMNSYLSRSVKMK